MKRTVMAIIEVEDSVNNGQVLDTFEKSLGQSNCNIENAMVIDKDSDSAHERYLNYLMNWIVDHHEEEFKGCSPAGFDEYEDWEDREDEDEGNVECDGDKRYNVYEYKNLTPKQLREIYRDVTGLSNDYEFTNQEIVDYLLDTLQEKENND